VSFLVVDALAPCSVAIDFGKLFSSSCYPTQLRPTLKRIDAYVIRWARRKYKRMSIGPRVQGDFFSFHAARVNRYLNQLPARHRIRPAAAALRGEARC
jgi:hypothetical protein